MDIIDILDPNHQYRISREEIEKRFTHHPPKDGQVERYESLRNHTKALAFFLLDHTPHSYEQRIAIYHLESFVMWANAAIARNE